jgi:hypothetical protein
MDIIYSCLSLAPVPYLAPAFSALRFIWLSVQQVQASQQQLEALAQSIAQLLHMLDEEFRAGRLLQSRTSTPLADLCRYVRFHCAVDPSLNFSYRLLDEVSAFIQNEKSSSFLKLLFTKDQRISQIQGFHKRIHNSVISFQVSCDALFTGTN